MSNIILKHAHANVYKNVTHAFWGIDVGIRNIGMALLGRVETDLRPRLIYLGLLDLGTDAVHDDEVLFNNIVEYIGAIYDHVEGSLGSHHGPFYRAMAIETQQKQTEEARMIMVAGAIKAVFTMNSHRVNPGLPFHILNQSPSCITCLEMQRYIDLPGPSAVTKRAEKKEKANEMMDHWLRTTEEGGALYEVNTQLRVKRKNSDVFLKGGDRRDHVADALFHAMYALKNSLY